MTFPGPGPGSGPSPGPSLGSIFRAGGVVGWGLVPAEVPWKWVQCGFQMAATGHKGTSAFSAITSYAQ